MRKVKIKDQILQAEFKSSLEGLRKGMQGRGHLDGCMVFMMPDKGRQSFWMKDCLIPLDIVICDNNVITAIHDNCEPCEAIDCPSYAGIGNVVIEFNAGFCAENGVKVGDSISIV